MMSWNSYRSSANIVKHAFGNLQIFRSERDLHAAEKTILPGSAILGAALLDVEESLQVGLRQLGLAEGTVGPFKALVMFV